MVYQVLVKPAITEKSEMLAENENKYTFIVDKRASKLQIKEAIERMYDVSVRHVNTNIIPAKKKLKATKAGYVMGGKPAFKKAVVTVSEDDFIDYYGEI
ncbi:MAG: 50S ribosomal protein L23 [Bacteroidetes bacterium]|jgi:large subunit ribosomal protein L23|nr:50S ribosomal protein L23 [Bacteroidota bacterium]